MPQINGRGFAHLLLILFTLLLLGGIGIGLYLVQNPTFFKPKAAENPTDPETFRLQNPKSELQKYLNPYGEAWENKRIKNPDIPNMITALFDRTCGATVARCEKNEDGSWKEPWHTQLQYNRFLPDYFKADPWTVFPVPGVTYTLDYQGGYDNLIKKANSDLNVIGGGAGRASSKLNDGGFGNNMQVFKIVTQETKKLNPSLKSYGYYIINFTEEPNMAGYPKVKNDLVTLENPAQESWFVHRKGTGTTCIDYFQGVCQQWNFTPQDRLGVSSNQYILDVTNPTLQDYMAIGVANSMLANGVDMLLIDGSGTIARLPLANGESTDAYPDKLTPAAIFEGNKQTLGKIKARLNAIGKTVYFNPIQPDVFDDARLKQVMELLQVTDGSYWEDPFRVPNRDEMTRIGGPDHYFNMLQKYFDVFKQMNKKLIVETNTIRNLETSSILNLTTFPDGNRALCQPYFGCEYQAVLNQVGFNAWLKEEQRIARLDLGMYLLFMDPGSTYYKHHTIMEEASYETSEDFWADFDLQIGTPAGPKEKLANNVYRRIFQNAQVWVNYSNQPYTLPAGALPCDDFHQGQCRTAHYISAEGEPVTSYTLQPFSAMIFAIPWIIDANNPSFETVWNWKPNSTNWGSLDYSVFHSGRRSHKIQSGLPGSPGLAQKYNFLPNTTYTWSAWVKTENNQNPQTVSVMVPGGVTSTTSQIQDSRFVVGNILPTGTNDWKKVQMTFTTGQGGQGNIYSVIQGGSNGTVWFDDVKLTEGATIDPNFTSQTLAYCNGTTSRIHLEWTPVPGASGYYVYRGTTKIADATNIAYNDEVVTPGTSYTYHIEAQVGPNINAGENKTITAVSCTQSPSPSPSPSRSPSPSPSPSRAPSPSPSVTTISCNINIQGVTPIQTEGITAYQINSGAQATITAQIQPNTYSPNWKIVSFSQFLPNGGTLNTATSNPTTFTAPNNPTSTDQGVTIRGDLSEYPNPVISCPPITFAVKPKSSPSPSPTVNGDVDGSGTIDYQDYNAFVGFFRAQDNRADVNHSNTIDIFDYNDLLLVLRAVFNP